MADRGRPTDYDLNLADIILERISTGESVAHICRDPDMPAKASVYRWLWKFPEFRDKYAQACEIRSEVHAEEMIDISDDGTDDFVERFDKDGENGWWEFRGEHVQRSKLRVDTRKWVASKLLPKKYGDRQQINHESNIPINIVINDGRTPDKDRNEID